ncbi:hypothetical protein IM792_10910 [Mucilaginibacter sp. JRF]|uniref:hypothetical protein n=1 Tax=Mucilaginibacter sp. JRF TaxID=2780088 RepID=UPI001880C33A|nr:hypothetical protein [Mucilaginibacter sp. JRF]MBE9584958.1 hypothetical protein [Mucilaginibacter sp. JRF]
MKALFLSCFIFISIGFIQAKANEHDPETIRKHLITALKSSKTTDSLYDKLDAVKHKNALITGYLGTLQALKAVHAWNPITKLKYLNAAEKTYAEAVAADPHNIEIRFMRFSVEHNVPGFLGFRKNIDDDRKTIIEQLKKKNYSDDDKDLIKTTVKFLIDSKRCTAAENEYLNKQLAALK